MSDSVNQEIAYIHENQLYGAQSGISDSKFFDYTEMCGSSYELSDD